MNTRFCPTPIGFAVPNENIASSPISPRAAKRVQRACWRRHRQCAIVRRPTRDYLRVQSCDKEIGPGSAFWPACGMKLQAGDRRYGENVLPLIRGSTHPGLAKMTHFDLFF